MKNPRRFHFKYSITAALLIYNTHSHSSQVTVYFLINVWIKQISKSMILSGCVDGGVGLRRV